MRPFAVAALGLAACGRVGFDPTARGDAGGDAMAVRLSPCPLPDTIPDPIAITGATFRYTSFDNMSATVSDVAVAAQIGGAVAVQMRSAMTGDYTLPVPTRGEIAPVVLVAEQPGYYTSWVYSDVPLVGAVAGQRGPVFSYGDLPLWNPTGMSQVYMAGGETLDTQRGTINVAVRDCDGQSIAGVAVTITPAPPTQFYQNAQGTPANRTSTQLPYTHAIALGAAAGPTTITASAPGLEFLPLTVDVKTGMNNTLVVIHAVR